MKKTLALILTFIMVLALVPTVALAEEPKTIYVDANNGKDTNEGSKDNPYKTVGKAAEKAATGSTIYLADGNYSTYTPEKQPNYGNKNLTFIGNSKDKVIWQIGAKTPNPDLLGTEYNGDYSFDSRSPGEHDYTIKFQNLTLMSADKDYLGFIGADNTVVEDCIIEGKTFYWGYTSATFTKTTFNCPAGDYAVWTYCSPKMTFESCTFNSTGKVINVYTDYSAGKHDITVNFKNCTVNNTGESLKPVLNINDSNMGNFKYILNITGDNNVTGVKTDNMTCSCLFGFGGKEKNPEYVNGSPYYSNNNKTVVTINNVKVWEGGKRVCDHNGVVFTTGSYNGDKTTQYTDGYKDNAFTVTYGEWSAWNYDTRTRTFTKICKYCGYKEEGTEKETRIVEHHDHYHPTTTPVPVIVIPPKTGDMTVWQSILHFFGIK